VGTSLVLFRLFGIDVRVHWSFLLVLAYGAFIYSSGPAGPLVGAVYGVLVTALLFVCVLLHEFGHALVAKYFRVGVSNITLLPIGGVANLERMPDKPIQEFMIAVAGPLVNFVLVVLLLPLTVIVLGIQSGFDAVGGNLRETLAQGLAAFRTPGLANLMIYLVFTNLMLGIFNLLPAFPMDGGRILRALLAMAMPYVQATRTAVFVGRIFAILMAIWGIFGGGIILLLIAFFIYVGGGAEREAVESKAVLKHMTAGQALTPNAVNLYTSEPLSRAVDQIMNSYQTDYPVLDLGGQFAGVLTKPHLIHALKTQGLETRIVDVMIRAEEVPVVAPDSTLDEAWDKMATGGQRVVAVKHNGQFLGILTFEDVSEVFSVLAASMVAWQPPAAGSRSAPRTPPAAPGQIADA
jgi:Zn-dependent protease